MRSYPFFLLALFVVGLGFAVLQIAANPYVTILGPERTAASRLNLAQAFNSVGTTTGPLIGGYLIFKYFARTGAHGAESVKVPYLAFCVVFLVIAGVFYFVKLPHVGEGKIEPGAGALRHPHVVLGALAIFMYVGGEVSVGSAIINFLGQPGIAGLSELDASKYVALYWGGMLIGRFMGAVELSDLTRRNKQLLLIAFPTAAFVILSTLRGVSFSLHYLPFLLLTWVLFQFGQGLAGRTLMLFSLMVVVLLTAEYSGRGAGGNVVRGGSGSVYFDRMVEHVRPGDRRRRDLQKPGLLIARHGDSWRSDSATPAGQARRPHPQPAIVVHYPIIRLRLRGVSTGSEGIASAEGTRFERASARPHAPPARLTLVCFSFSLVPPSLIMSERNLCPTSSNSTTQSFAAMRKLSPNYPTITRRRSRSAHPGERTNGSGDGRGGSPFRSQ
jgi:hypothetical protein